jgi:hypothetical protein
MERELFGAGEMLPQQFSNQIIYLRAKKRLYAQQV